MKIYAFFIAAFIFMYSQCFAIDLRDKGPTGKSWFKITDIHYLDKSSVKKIGKDKYQLKMCNSAPFRGGTIWNYFEMRLDCKKKVSWSKVDGRWEGPMQPVNFDSNAMLFVCR